MWKLYLVNDQHERVVPVEVRKLKRQDAVTPHFFPYITPWKSIYTVRFPYKMPATNQPIIKDNTKEIKLVITGVLGTAEMGWELRGSEIVKTLFVIRKPDARCRMPDPR